MATPNPASDDRRPRSRGLYGAVWRWHFYAGLFVVPVLLMLAVTGALYTFDDEIEAWWYRDLQVTPACAAPLPAASQEAAVQAAYPGAAIRRYTVAAAADRAAQWTIQPPGGAALNLFVEPCTGVVRGALEARWQLMKVISALHGELLLGTVGDWLVELAASWALVLLVTGLYLWWPERGDRLLGTLIPRLNAKGRVFWRDLHAVPAVWNALALGFLILSGLPWAGFWGGQLARLGTVSHLTAPTPNFVAAPTLDAAAPADPHAAHRVAAAGNDTSIPWAIRHDVAPQGGPARIGVAEVEAVARQRGVLGPGLRLIYPDGPGAVWHLSYIPGGATTQRTLYLDPADARVIDDIGYGRYSPLGKAVEWGVEIHLGRQFGLANQLLCVLVCGLTVLTVITGTVMWWRRRPPGGLRAGLGAPSRPKAYRTQTGVVVIAVVLGLLFPLMGASLVAVLILDVLIRRLLPTATQRRSAI
ncbi:MAG: PepSY domain-containing protein [Gammaproteobacteria bacterium]|nr:PepSY domain-containing protein [Gammaproteobacteria bacterium]